jgi:hypothetical protein
MTARTPAEVEAMAQAWFDRELERCRLAHGDAWPEHEAWVVDYLREELRERLREATPRREAAR